jgi:WD40 repeat protein
VTGGLSGLLLWPARPDPGRPGALRVGPPQPLAPGLKSRRTEGASASRDGRIVVVPDGRLATVIDRDRPGHHLKLGPQTDLRFTTVSPDGRWVVTGSHWADPRFPSAQIWDARSGELLHKLPLDGSTPSRFSPDGRWLMTSSRGGCRLWEAGTWREVRRFDPGPFVFGPDGRLLAIGDVFGVIRLVETATGREVARLTGPEPIGYHPLCFTGDGTRLIASGSGAAPLCVWDLRAIREQLKEMGLDWDWPEFRRADPAGETRPQVEIVTDP